MGSISQDSRAGRDLRHPSSSRKKTAVGESVGESVGENYPKDPEKRFREP